MNGPSDLLTLSEGILKRRSRYRSKEHAFSRFAPLKFEYLVDYAPAIHRVSMFEHIEFVGMTTGTIAFAWNSSRKLRITGITRKRPGCYSIDPIVATRLVCRRIRYASQQPGNVTVLCLLLSRYAYIPSYTITDQPIPSIKYQPKTTLFRQRFKHFRST